MCVFELPDMSNKLETPDDRKKIMEYLFNLTQEIRNLKIGTGQLDAELLLAIQTAGSNASSAKNDFDALKVAKIKANRIDVDNLYVKHLDAADGEFSGYQIIQDPSNANQWIYLGLLEPGQFGGFLTRDNGETYVRLFDINGLDGTAIIPGSFDPDTPQFTYTGEYESLADGDGNWRIKFLTSGTFTPLMNMTVDIFLVGGGGGGSVTGGGGGGGYTLTQLSVALTKDTGYPVVVGDGGADETDGDSSTMSGYEAAGGIAAVDENGGAGASGGGAAAYDVAGDGATDGADGWDTANADGGTGQGTTTKEFGTGDKYGGGGGGAVNTNLTAPPDTLNFDHTEQNSRSYYNGEYYNSWADKTNVTDGKISQDNSTSSGIYHDKYQFQLRVPANAYLAAASIQSVKLHLFVNGDGLYYASSKLRVGKTTTYRNTVPSYTTMPESVDGYGEKILDITSIVSSVNYANLWYLDLALYVAGASDWDDFNFCPDIDHASYAPYLEFEFSTQSLGGDGQDGGGNGYGTNHAASSGHANTGGGAGGGDVNVVGGSGIVIIRKHIA